MAKKEGATPLRHGWGGDLKKRDRILRERAQDATEAKDFPEKYGKDSSYAQKYAAVYTAFTPRKSDVVIQWIVDALHYNQNRKGLLVDVGCGPAEIQPIVERLGYSYIGIDKNPYMLARARKERPESLVMLGDGGDLPLRQGIASVVLMNTLVHSVDSLWGLNAMMEEAGRVLRPDGLLIVTMLNEQKTEKLVPLKKRQIKSMEPQPIKFPAKFPGLN